VGLPAAEFSSFDMYQVMTYMKGSLIFRMLRDVLGEDTFRAGLREYYQRFRFRQVTGRDFQNVMEESSGQDLEWFFHQFLRTSHALDFRVRDTELTGSPGNYTLVAEIVREGRAWMPVVVEAGGQRQRLRSRERVQRVTFHLADPVETVTIDPDRILPLIRRGR
jgi:aminopeptidase N